MFGGPPHSMGRPAVVMPPAAATAGRFWVDDDGSADNSEQFAALHAYSPYLNNKPVKYPATLIAMADTEWRIWMTAWYMDRTSSLLCDCRNVSRRRLRC